MPNPDTFWQFIPYRLAKSSYKVQQTIGSLDEVIFKEYQKQSQEIEHLQTENDLLHEMLALKHTEHSHEK